MKNKKIQSKLFLKKIQLANLNHPGTIKGGTGDTEKTDTNICCCASCIICPSRNTYDNDTTPLGC